MCCQRCEIFSAQAADAVAVSTTPTNIPFPFYFFVTNSLSLAFSLPAVCSVVCCVCVWQYSPTHAYTLSDPKNRTLHTIQNRAAVVHPLLTHSAPRRARVLSSSPALGASLVPRIHVRGPYIWQKRDADTSDLRLRMCMCAVVPLRKRAHASNDEERIG